MTQPAQEPITMESLGELDQHGLDLGFDQPIDYHPMPDTPRRPGRFDRMRVWISAGAAVAGVLTMSACGEESQAVEAAAGVSDDESPEDNSTDTERAEDREARSEFSLASLTRAIGCENPMVISIDGSVEPEGTAWRPFQELSEEDKSSLDEAGVVANCGRLNLVDNNLEPAESPASPFEASDGAHVFLTLYGGSSPEPPANEGSDYMMFVVLPDNHGYVVVGPETQSAQPTALQEAVAEKIQDLTGGELVEGPPAPTESTSSTTTTTEQQPTTTEPESPETTETPEAGEYDWIMTVTAECRIMSASQPTIIDSETALVTDLDGIGWYVYRNGTCEMIGGGA